MTSPVKTAGLSWTQEFLCALDHGATAGALSQWYTVNYGLRLSGQVDASVLAQALNDVVARHEILRSSLVREAEHWHTVIHPPTPARLLVRDEPPPEGPWNARAHELLNEAESEPFGAGEVPLLRALLVRFGSGDSLLVLTTHHIASDAWSMRVIIRDLAASYAARAARRGHDLTAAYQYRDFASWQRTNSDPRIQEAQRYWREKLLGGRVHALPADRVLPAGAPDPYSVHRFAIDAGTSALAAELARSVRSSLFVVLLAAYNVLAGGKTGSTDLTVPTFTAGRTDPRLRDAVGPYYNFLPIRTDLAGCASFLDVIAATRASCLDAYAHDIPFLLIEAEAGDLMRPCSEQDLQVVAFEMLPPATGGSGRAGDISYHELPDRTRSQTVGAGTPKGMLWALDRLRSGDIVGSVRFSRDRFDEETIPALVSEYRRLLAAVVADPSARLDA
jgi:hypothetical protein